MEQLHFTKGFNDGFILATYEKETAEKLSTIPKHSLYAEGLLYGIAEVSRELSLTQEFEHIRTQSIDHSKNRSI